MSWRTPGWAIPAQLGGSQKKVQLSASCREYPRSLNLCGKLGDGRAGMIGSSCRQSFSRGAPVREPDASTLGK
jgi:hypothetical protein